MKVHILYDSELGYSGALSISTTTTLTTLAQNFLEHAPLTLTVVVSLHVNHSTFI